MYYNHNLLATSQVKLHALKISSTKLFNKFYIKFQEYTGVLTWDNTKDQEDLFKKSHLLF